MREGLPAFFPTLFCGRIRWCSSALTERKEWKFFGVLPKADPGLAAAWWTVLLLRGILPAAFAIAMGVLVGAVQRGDSLAGPLALAGAIFVLLQVLSPIHQAVSANLGDRTAAWLYDRLTEACVRPPGMGHLEDPALTSDLTVARDFDLGMTGPPLSISMDFIASGMVEMIGGVASAADPRPIRVVGADPARGRVAGDALAAARERDLVRPQHRGGARRAAGCRLRLPPGGGSAREQGTAAVRPRRLDHRPLHRPAHSPARAAVRGHAPARASRRSGACCWWSRRTSWCSGCWRAPPPLAASVSAKPWSTCRARSACR